MALITGPGGVGKSSLAAQAIFVMAELQGCPHPGLPTVHWTGLFLYRIGEFMAIRGTPSLLQAILPNPRLSIDAKIV